MSKAPPEDQFSVFVEESWERLWRTAYLLVGDAHLAEDLVQSALVKTYASWRKVRHVDRAYAYARVVLMNTAVDGFRRKSWKGEVSHDEVPDRILEFDFAETVASREEVAAALVELSPRQRAVLVLRYFEDLSITDTAAVLRCSEGNVKRHTADGLARLRGLLEPGTQDKHPHSIALVEGIA